MCRQNQAMGLAIIAFSAGLFVGSCCQLSFGLFLVGFGGLIVGFGMIKKK